ncbi:MAG TPA: L,D-transpeptidase family protein [Blastocatellia bacterium]|nr:L,D-transpeptidase family protein [Blastocatellia bacterium]
MQKGRKEKRIDRLKCATATALAVFLLWPLTSSPAFAQKSSNLSKSANARKARPKKQPITRKDIKEAEQLLSNLGYWGGPIDGRMDEATRHALIAFQKVEGRTPTGRLTRNELEALRAARRPEAREGGEAHIEIDLTRQILFVVDEEGLVSKVLPISSGNGEEFTSEGWTRRAITPTGRFKVHRKIEGLRKSPLGLLYNPVYYLSGIAIHGSPSVPARPASHGCVRIPIFASKEFNQMADIGMWVYVYEDSTSEPD